MKTVAPSPSTEYRICPICEAGCGLKIRLASSGEVAVSANPQDKFSSGHICAKGIALGQLHADPDRLRAPLVRDGDTLRPATWDEAFNRICEGLNGVRAQHGADAVATYIGNPTAHNFGLSAGLGVFAGAAGSRHIYSAGSVDQLPKQLASELMFGNGMGIPVPDMARCDLLVMLGANPVVSNGSLWMVPDFRGKLKALQARGGQLVTIDPRRSETARLADQHHFIRPGTDAWLLTALINELRALGKSVPEPYLTSGADTLFAQTARVSTTNAETVTGIPAHVITGLAQTIARAERPVLYGRVGTTLQQNGTLTSFLLEVINVMTGSLDFEGGAMFPEQPFRAPPSTRHGIEYNRYRSRVSGYPEVLGQLPAASMAEEMERPGDGQIRALVCFAGNPVISTPDSQRMAAAIRQLDFVVCVDIYHNETTGLADVVLPGASPFEKLHYDSFLGAMGHRNVARYSAPLIASDAPSEWEIGLTLAWIAQHQSVPDTASLRAFEDTIVASAATTHCNREESPLFGRDVQEIMSMLEGEQGEARLLDLGVRAGPWGDHFGEREGISLAVMRANPDGIDMGPVCANRRNDVIRHKDKRIDLAPEVIIDALTHLQPPEAAPFSLIGRRQPQANNSWLGNLPGLARTKRPCVLDMHPEDAARLNLEDGEWALVTSAVGELAVEVRVSSDMAPGVVSLPHGFSTMVLPQRNKARAANYNQLSPSDRVDPVSATAALNGVPVSIRKAAAPAAEVPQ